MNNLIASALFCVPMMAHAGGDLSRQDPVRVNLTVGSVDGQPKFTPDRLTFETGKLHVLRIDNPGEEACYFSSQGMAAAVYKRKVSVLDATGNALREMYGPVRRV